MSETVRARPDKHEWKIRNMPTRDSAAAVAAAERAEVGTAEWVALAIREKLAREREPIEGEVVAPDSPMPAVIDPEAPRPALSPPEVVAYVEAYSAYLAMRGDRLPANGKVMREAERLLHQGLAAVGIQPPKRRSARKLSAGDGPALAAERAIGGVQSGPARTRMAELAHGVHGGARGAQGNGKGRGAKPGA